MDADRTIPTPAPTESPLAPVWQAVADEHRAIRGCVIDARRRLLGTCARALAVIALTCIVWFILGGQVVDATRLVLRGSADLFAAIQYAALAVATVVAWYLALVALYRARHAHKVARRWARGVPFDCPACRYPLPAPTARCPECGWIVRTASPR